MIVRYLPSPCAKALQHSAAKTNPTAIRRNSITARHTNVGDDGRFVQEPCLDGTRVVVAVVSVPRALRAPARRSRHDDRAKRQRYERKPFRARRAFGVAPRAAAGRHPAVAASM